MVERADAASVTARRRPAATKLLFSQGHFERLAPHKQQPAPAVTSAVKQPSTSSQFQYCCRRRRASTESGEDNVQHERIKEAEKQENEEGDNGVGSIVGNFSILAEGILGLWEGEDSVRRRIEGLGERQQVMKQEIKGAEEVQRELRERLGVLEQQAQEEQVSLRHLKQERLHTLAQNMNTDQYSITSSSPSPASSLHHRRLHVNITARTGASAPTVSSDGYPYVAIFSSRQLVAFEMLEFVHRRLTSHMWAHMWEKVSSLQGEEERGGYLRVFRGIEGQSAFGAKPLSEATYTELLGFSKQELVVGGGAEVEEALAAAEGRLAKEACKEGYPLGTIGDIRQQIMDVYLRCQRHFKSVALAGNLRQYLQLNHCLQGASTSKACHQHEQLIISDRLSNLLHEVLHPDLISHTQQAARLCKLGALQPAAQLIQLGCYLLSKSSSQV